MPKKIDVSIYYKVNNTIKMILSIMQITETPTLQKNIIKSENFRLRRASSPLRSCGRIEKTKRRYIPKKIIAKKEIKPKLEPKRKKKLN